MQALNLWSVRGLALDTEEIMKYYQSRDNMFNSKDV